MNDLEKRILYACIGIGLILLLCRMLISSQILSTMDAMDVIVIAFGVGFLLKGMLLNRFHTINKKQEGKGWK